MNKPNKESTTATIWSRTRTFLHDQVTPDTSIRYYSFLHHIPDNSYVLDTDVGTASALVANANLIHAKTISIIALQPDRDYAEKSRQALLDANLDTRVRVIDGNVFTFNPPAGRLFNYVLFPKFPCEQVTETLTKSVDLLVDREDGRVIVTETFELQKNLTLEWWRPALQSLTAVNVGVVVYEADFEDAVSAADLHIESTLLVPDAANVKDIRETRLISLRSRLYITRKEESLS